MLTLQTGAPKWLTKTYGGLLALRTLLYPFPGGKGIVRCPGQWKFILCQIRNLIFPHEWFRTNSIQNIAQIFSPDRSVIKKDSKLLHRYLIRVPMKESEIQFFSMAANTHLVWACVHWRWLNYHISLSSLGPPYGTYAARSWEADEKEISYRWDGKSRYFALFFFPPSLTLSVLLKVALSFILFLLSLIPFGY